ncbi:MAG: N-acetylmuramoyl-L-alanine amidase [Monoglobaceae bacterium]
MLVAIDAGHYLNTPGKRCAKSIDVNETREWVLNSRMAEYVEEYLKDYECAVMRCDDRTGKTDTGLSERANKANRAGADVLISIHHNAGMNGGSGGGICVYAAKNASAASSKLQKSVYEETVKLTGLKGNRATPLPVENFTVIFKAEMPAVLGEFGFMDSTTDVPVILTDEFSKKCAQGIVNALVKTFNIKKKPIKEDEEEMAVRYKTIEEMPTGYQKEAKKLVEYGVLRGKNGSEGLDVTEDMLRCMIINMRLTEKLLGGK